MPFVERDDEAERKALQELLETSEEARQAHEEYVRMYNFKADLLEARKNENMTQKELSAASGLTQQSISRVEKNTANITIETLMKYLRGIGYKLKFEKIV